MKTILIATLLVLASGCAPTPFNGQPIEQLTVRFNGDFMEHAGEYRLIRPLAQQNQCLWQLYADGQLTAVGQIPLPADGLSAVFAEAAAGVAGGAATTQPATRAAGLGDRGGYVVHFTYDTPYERQEAEFAGSLPDIAAAMKQAGQISAIHKIVVKKAPASFWFVHLEQSRVSD